MRAVLPVLAICSSFVLSLCACAFAQSFALRRSLLDRPNERSLHQTPVPRLGGVAIVLATYLVSLALGLAAGIAPDTRLWLLTGLPVALLGLLDDLRPLSAAARLLFQIAAAAALCALVPLPASITLTPALSVTLPLQVTAACAVLWLVALLNIYNFMDGMDGLAGAQAVGAALSLALAAYATANTDLMLSCLVIAAAAGGFLVLNVPPARLFMGDVGSTFLGFSFATISLIGLSRPVALPFSAAVFGLAPFLCDGVFTLLRRALRGEKIWQAHKSHLYQRAVATGLSHRAVLVPYCAWIALGVGAAALELSSDGECTAAIAAGLAGAFGVAYGWVRHRERQALQA